MSIVCWTLSFVLFWTVAKQMRFSHVYIVYLKFLLEKRVAISQLAVNDW